MVPKPSKNGAWSYLRGKVRYRPAVGAHRRPRAIKIAQTEVGELYLAKTAGAGQQNVVQLHVSVADVLVVRVAHSAHDLCATRRRANGV